MNTKQTDYLVIDELVRRAHHERSVALGNLVGDGMLAVSASVKRAIAWVTRGAGNAVHAAQSRNQHAH